VSELISQLTDFVVEKYDDLANTFSIVVHQFIVYANRSKSGVEWI
jgi:hypothetical protein